MDVGDWRTQLQTDSRQRIVNKIMETLKRRLPFPGPEALLELKKIALRFEESVYSAATTQSDYLKQISLKMLTMERKSQNPIATPPQSNAPSNIVNLQDQEEFPGMDVGDWRIQLQPDSRQRIVNKIMETLNRHLPFSGPEGLQEITKIALRFEESVYSSATSVSDYLRKISSKMLTLETKSQNPIAIPRQSNDPSNSMDLQDQEEFPGMDVGDWRTQLQPDSRQRIVNKMMETLKRRLPFSGPEALLELKEIALRFEESVYSAATSQSDYLWKISSKMLTMETKSQNLAPRQSNAPSNSMNPPDQG